MKTFIRLFLMYLVFGVLMVFGIIKFNQSQISIVTLGDACFMVGALFLFIGLLRFLYQSNIFTLVVYSYKKFFEIVRVKKYTKEKSQLKDYHDYLEKQDKKPTPYAGIVVNGLLFYVAAAIMVWDKF